MVSDYLTGDADDDDTDQSDEFAKSEEKDE